MKRKGNLKLILVLVVAVFTISLCIGLAVAQGNGNGNGNANGIGNGNGNAIRDVQSIVEKIKKNRQMQEQRKIAAKNLAKKRKEAGGINAQAIAPPGGVPDYFGVANWANSPALAKFVDTLPGLGAANASSTLGTYISIAVPDKTTYPGSDYYEIGVVQYTQKFHRDLPPTTLRGYVQLNDPAQPVTKDANGTIIAWPTPHYLGPVIISTKDIPVRIKFTNLLPAGMGGDLFIPVDTSVMGSGMGPLGAAGMNFTQNRADLHLHGGKNPWISDGTPHQWITPAGEMSPYKQGVSMQNVPDMPNPGPGSSTYYYSNQQSSRLMFYHDHSWGITRLNVYVGEAAGYLITDAVEEQLINDNIIPNLDPTGAYRYGIPLIIQDKSFVDATTVRVTDPTWNWGTGMPDVNGIRPPVTGDLWYPHVYVPAQNPYDITGANAYGRWHYGPWFWPPTNVPFMPVPNPYCLPTPPAAGSYPNGTYDNSAAPWEPPYMPGVPNVSIPGESFLDVAMVNGAAYPTVTVEPKAYRFRILNAANDRFFNLQMYVARSIVNSIQLTGAGSGYTADPIVTITPNAPDTAATAYGATATATIDPDPASLTYGQVIAIALDTVGSGYTVPPTVTIAPPTSIGGVQATASATVYTAPTEVGMVPAAPGSAGFPTLWPRDGRAGGVPDPATIGPSWIQIGTEGGFLPQPVVIPNQPITWNANPTTFNFGNVVDHSLLVGTAERADVIVDFSAYAGKTIIVYNDAPAAFPALDPRYDYYTGAPDLTGEGGHSGPQAGFGPNTRTVMQIVVANTTPVPFNTPALYAAFQTTATADGVFKRSQAPIIAGQTAYNTAYNMTFPNMWPNWGVARIQDNSLSFMTPAGTTLTIPMKPKAIHDEMGAAYDEYGRMSGKLGLEIPNTTSVTQTFILQNYVDPVTEDINDCVITGVATLGDGTQIWKVTHNGVDTHTIHFHLFDVQLINRVGWDGAIRLPDKNELGWKDTLRFSPLEDTIVALRAVSPKAPWGQPDSIRPLNPMVPIDSPMGFTSIDPVTGQPIVPPVTNQIVNFGWEYVWHCHILSHEEMDMMRPVRFNVARGLPLISGLTATGPSIANLSWIDGTPFNYVTGLPVSTIGDPNNEVGFRVERAVNLGAWNTQYAFVPANTTTFSEPIDSTQYYQYRVVAFNAAGETVSNTVSLGTLPNAAPVITSVTATPASILDTQTSQLLVSANDPDAGPSPLSYNWIVPAGAGSVSNAAIANPVYTPPNVASTQVYTLTVQVSDGSATVSSTVNVTVNDTIVGPVVYQAEDALYSATGVQDSTAVAGYTGTGFADYTVATGAWIQWTVNVPTAGQYKLSFRYGLEGTGSNRPLRVTINGTIFETTQAFPGTGAWTTWKTVSLMANLNAGNNTITLTTIGLNGANIDSLTVAPYSPAAVIYEAESPPSLYSATGVVNSTIVAGYTGTGFADYTAASGAWIQWTVTVPAAGSYNLQFRYASATGNRPLDVAVNGVLAIPTQNFLVTGAWTNWRYVGAVVNLNAGVNTIRTTTIGLNGGNMDHLIITAN